MDILEIIIIILLGYIIIRDIGRYDRTSKKKEKKIDEAREQEMRERKRELDNIMDYSIEKAIESKRSDN